MTPFFNKHWGRLDILYTKSGMKRQREVDSKSLTEKLDTNFFFSTIKSDPDILSVIFKNLKIRDLLTIYRVLYQYFFNDVYIMNVLEKFLKSKTDITERLLEFNNSLFLIKMKKLSTSNLYLKYPLITKSFDDESLSALPKPISFMDKYNDIIKKYSEFRWTRNFVKYGFCEDCQKITEIDYIKKIKGYDVIELESKFIYLCNKCTKKLNVIDDSLPWLNQKDVTKSLPSSLICKMLFKKFQIRRLWNSDTKEWTYYYNDVYSLEKRTKSK